jgi:hypothetical protein
LDFDFKLALDKLNIRPTWILVRDEVLYAVLRELNCDNKTSIARLVLQDWLISSLCCVIRRKVIAILLILIT